MKLDRIKRKIKDLEPRSEEYIKQVEKGIRFCERSIKSLEYFQGEESSEITFYKKELDFFKTLLNQKSEPSSSVEAKYVVIDIETTGFSPDKCSIIEVGALKVDKNLNVISKYESFVHSSYVPRNITELTGIDVTMTKNAPSIEKVMQELSDFSGDAIPIAHYAPFDKRFVRHYLNSTSTNYIETDWIDSIQIFKKNIFGVENYKLETLIRHFNLASKEDHRALSDAMHTLTILRKCEF